MMVQRRDNESGWFPTVRRRLSKGRSMAAVGVVATLALSAAGCDTVAQISFPKRTFEEVDSSGFIPPSNSCQGVGDGGDMKLRFVLLDDANSPIRLGGEPVDGQSVELDSNSVSLTSSALMETSGVCSADGECSSDSNFTCGRAPGIGSSNAEDLQRCFGADEALAVTSGPSAVDFVADNSQNQVFGLLLENSGSLEGWTLPETRHKWDKNGNETPDSPTGGDLLSPPPRVEQTATDLSKKRAIAVQQTYSAWSNAYDLAKSERRHTFLGVWSFDATLLNPASHVANAADDEATRWVEKPTDGADNLASAAIRDYRSLNTNVDPTRANVYESIESVIDNAYTTDAMQRLNVQGPDSIDKMLVVFVDGYDDLRETDNTTIDNVVEAATANNVKVFVIQVDPKLNEPGKLREDPNYIDGQSPCSDSTGCKNYEECRDATVYFDTDGDVINEDAAGPDTYCLPKRNEFGQVGPIDDYARLACATGGGYMYAPSADGISRAMTWLPYALDGLWEASVQSGRISRGNAPKGVPLQISTQMSVTVSGKNITYPFTQLGGASGAGQNATSDDLDTRSVVFTAD